MLPLTSDCWSMQGSTPGTSPAVHRKEAGSRPGSQGSVRPSSQGSVRSQRSMTASAPTLAPLMSAIEPLQGTVLPPPPANMPGAARADKWLKQLSKQNHLRFQMDIVLLEDQTSSYPTSIGGSAFPSPKKSKLGGPKATVVTILSSPSSPIGVLGATAMASDGLKDARPASTSRRLRAVGGGIGGAQGQTVEANGWHEGTQGLAARMVEKTPSVRASAASRTNRPISERLVIGSVAALECDRKFQRELMQHWKRESEADDAKEAGEQVARQHLCLFFDFLKGVTGDVKVSQYIMQAIGDTDYEAELRKAPPESDYGQVLDLQPRQTKAVKDALGKYSQVSRPSSNGLGEFVFRPSFCRFLIDSKLVCFDSKTNGWPRYHYSVRMFDSLARHAPVIAGSMPAPGGQRCATLDQCVAIIAQLLGQVQLPAVTAWGQYEKNLEKAQLLAQSLLDESKRRQKVKAQASEAESTEEAASERRMELFGKHGSPPNFFCGSLREWSRGLRLWVEFMNEQCTPEAASQRVEQSFAVQQFIKDMLVEPGCIHVAIKFADLFKAIYQQYADERRVRSVEEHGGQVRSETVPHMSFASFFRFLIDFGVFPHLCAFDEAWSAYRNAESSQVLGSAEHPVQEKMWRAVKKLQTMKSAGRLARKHKLSKKGSAESSFGRRRSSSGLQSNAGDNNSDCESGSENKSRTSRTSDASGSSCGEEEMMRKDTSGSKRIIEEDKLQPAVHAKAAAHPSHATHGLHPPSVPQGQQRRPSIRDLAIMSTEALGRHRRPSINPAEAQLLVPPAANMANEAAAARARRHSNVAQDAPQANEQPRRSTASTRRTSVALIESVSFASPTFSPVKSQDGKRVPSERVDMEASRRAIIGQEEQHERIQDGKDILDEALQEPRIKESTDCTWVKKRFSSMSEEERSAYSLLNAIADCTAERFLNVRGLLQWAGAIGLPKGDMEIAVVLRALKELKIVHGYDSADNFKEFVGVVDPYNKNCRELLDPSDLEKAVDAVRDDRVCRWPKGWQERGAERVPLGERARELSIAAERSQALSEKLRQALPSEDTLENDVSNEHESQPRTAFCLAAFVETLLFLGMQHMHGNGVPVKTAAPGGVKSLWLIAFLHARFDQAVLDWQARSSKDKSKTPLSFTPSWTDGSRSRGSSDFDSTGTRPAAISSFTDATSPASHMSDDRPLSAKHDEVRRLEPRRQVDERASEVAVSPVSSVVKKNSRRNSTPGVGGTTVKQVRLETATTEVSSRVPISRATSGLKHSQTEEFLVRPEGAKYVSRLQSMLQEQPDLFSKYLDGPGEPAGEDDPVWGKNISSNCDTCGRKTDNHGLGSVFCHACSGVDFRPLSDSILYSVFERVHQRRMLVSNEARAQAIEIMAKSRAAA